MSIAILGAGAFGTGLAISLARKGPVTLWARDAGADIARAAQADTILLAIPLQKLRAFLTLHADLLAGKSLVACCKGIEIATGAGPVTVIADTVPSALPAILTGPSFASDIARGLPTALTLACADQAGGRALQDELSTANLRLYRTRDTAGAELGGALKNVIAIACGAAMGAGLGESARAALMTRGYAEMQRLAQALNAHPETLAGLSGFGDLTLTCTSAQSRNYRLGLSLGTGDAFAPDTTVEGAATAQAVHRLAQRADLDMPITAAVAGVLDGSQNVANAMQSLLARPLKEE